MRGGAAGVRGVRGQMRHGKLRGGLGQKGLQMGCKLGEGRRGGRWERM